MSKLLLIVWGVVTLLVASGATAATIHVPGDHALIGDAIAVASAGDTVLVHCGTYYEGNILMKAGVYLVGETGQPGCVTIDAEQQSATLKFFAVGGTAWIEGLTFAHGRLVIVNSSPTISRCVMRDGIGGSGTEASGIYCYNSSVTLTDVAITGNSSTGYCGGMYCCAGSSPTLTRVTFEGNSGANGGGLRCVSSSLTLRDCAFSGNDGGLLGGGLFLEAGSTASLEDVTFVGNSSALYGGGMHCDGSSAEFTSCTFSENASTRGGGLSCRSRSSLTLTDVSFTSNSGEHGHGGGAYCDGYSSFAITGGTFSQNNANGGGAFYSIQCSPVFSDVRFQGNWALTGGALQFRNSSPVFQHVIVHSNWITHDCGGGMWLERTSAELENVTFWGNESMDPCGGAIHARTNSSLVMSRSIVFGAVGGDAIYCDDTSLPTLTCCDVYGCEVGDWTGCIAEQYGVNGNISEDPLFCYSSMEDVSLCEDSPCAPGNNPECGLIGALDVACGPCGPAVTKDTSWGLLKAMFK